MPITLALPSVLALSALLLGAPPPTQEPFKGSLPIRVTVLEAWKGAPAFGDTRVLSADEFATLVRDARTSNPHAVISRPRMEVVPGLKASISVGDSDASGKMMKGFTFESVVKLIEIPAGGKSHLYTMDLSCAQASDGKPAPASTVADIKIPQGSTAAFISTRNGEHPLLVCVTPGPDQFHATFTPDRVAAPADPTKPAPLINFIATIHRVDAPKDYGSPKGEGPRVNWAAYPGGATLTADEFKTYLTQLRAKPGYTMLAQPSVWVNPDQEAAIEFYPEPEAPKVRQAVRVKGTLDAQSGALKTTGSYSRSAGSMSTEGSWNQPKPCESGGAVVWSIHDPEQGAWFTLTLQPVVYPADKMPAPQTAR